MRYVTTRPFATLALALALGLACAQVDAPVSVEVAWPSNACAAEADGPERDPWSDWRPRLLDQVGPTPPAQLFMPVEGARVAEVYPSYGDPRSGGRVHIGIDIMAERGTPVRPAAPGYVLRTTDSARGGISVTLVGDGGVRYFYTHLDAVHEALVEGQRVETDTVLGYVGDSGNAAGTPTHLHFGVYLGSPDDLCDWRAVDPLPLLVDRE